MAVPADEQSAQLALKELRDVLQAQNPSFLHNCEKQANELIASYKQYGDSGKVALMFMALRISAAAERDEL